MSRSYYTNDEKHLTKLIALKDMVADQEIEGTPCPLMLSQLYELKMLASKLENAARVMIEATKERLK